MQGRGWGEAGDEEMVETQYMTGKKYCATAQPCMNQAKNLSFGLSLNIWQEKILNWTSALNELVHIPDSESQSPPWKKIYLWLSLDLNLYQGEKILKNVSLVEKIFICQQYIQGWRKTKNTQKGTKMGNFFKKKCNFQPQFMTSIHGLDLILALLNEIEWSQSWTFLVAEFGAISVSNVSGEN